MSTAAPPSADHHPGCPPSLENLIMTYHRAHSNSLRLAHDLSPGPEGLFSARLAEYFRHVHVSDRDPSVLASARRHLGTWATANWWKGRFTFSLVVDHPDHDPEHDHGPDDDHGDKGKWGGGEGDCVTPGSVDLVAVLLPHARDLGRAGVEGVVRGAVAEMLAPNGTMAVVAWDAGCRVVGNAGVDAVVRRLFGRWQRGEEQEGEEGGEGGEGGREGKGKDGSSPLDAVPVPEGLFIQDVTKRIKINFGNSGDRGFEVPGLMGMESRVSSEHRTYEFNDGDADAAGWRREVGAEWFREAIAAMDSSGGLDRYESDLQEIERRVKEDANGRVTVEWTAAVLLATRK